MPRDPRAYLSDILESCDAIEAAIEAISLEEYLRNRLVRSSVEREFIIMGEALRAISHKSPTTFDAITGARRIVDFRNRLTHQYSTLDDELVWALAKQDLQLLRRECKDLVDAPDRGSVADDRAPQEDHRGGQG